MSTLQEQKKLSESLLAACKAAGIEKPKNVAQDEDGQVWHYYTKPEIFSTCYSDGSESSSPIDHPPYADDWQESLLEWVEPQESLSEWKDGFRFTETEKQQIDALADEWCITIETEHDKDGEPVAYFIRNHKGDIVQMIRPDHIADTSKMVDPYKVQVGGVTLDPYMIASIYGINDPIIFQMLKKLLRFGRKHKDEAQDVVDTITSAIRWLEINAPENARLWKEGA